MDASRDRGEVLQTAHRGKSDCVEASIHHDQVSVGEKRDTVLGVDTIADAKTTSQHLHVQMPSPQVVHRKHMVSLDGDKFLLNSISQRLLQQIEKQAGVQTHVEPTHVMIWGHKAPSTKPLACVSQDERRKLLDLSKRMLATFVTTHHQILSVRILIAPPNNVAQNWHLDYRSYPGLYNQTLFIAMTPATASNCTECVNFASTQQARDFNVRVENSVLRAREAQLPLPEAKAALVADIDAATIATRRLLLDTFDGCLVPTSVLPHRRSQALDGLTRITLNIDFSTASAEAVQASKFVDDDSLASRSTAGVAGQDIIDNLYSEVVVRLVEAQQ